jgi:hypothetical protein
MHVRLDAVGQGAALVVWPVEAIHQPLSVAEELRLPVEHERMRVARIVVDNHIRRLLPPRVEHLEWRSGRLRMPHHIESHAPPAIEAKHHKHTGRKPPVSGLVLLARGPRALTVVVARVPAAFRQPSRPRPRALSLTTEGNCNTRA